MQAGVKSDPRTESAGSRKHAGTENFPVASRLIQRRYRPHVMALYRFARTADDIADAPDLEPADKHNRLDAMDAALTAEPAPNQPPTAVGLRESLNATGVVPKHARELLDGFRRDVDQRRYADWTDLLSYCRLSAAPIGRHVLDLHGEAASTYVSSDPLCEALQVINHLQDCKDDFVSLDRVYIPEPWLQTEGLDVSVLEERSTPPGLRRVINSLLDGVEELLYRARPLCKRVRNDRLALEISIIQAVAERLVTELRHNDPLAAPVKLGKLGFAGVATSGFARGLWTRLIG